MKSFALILVLLIVLGMLVILSAAITQYKSDKLLSDAIRQIEAKKGCGGDCNQGRRDCDCNENS